MSSSSSSPATGSAGHGTNASNGKGSNGHGNGNGNGSGSGGRPVSALAAALVGMGTGSSPHSHSQVGHHLQNGHNIGYSSNPRNGFNSANGHSHSHVVQSQPPHIQPHAHPPPYPYPQPPMQTAHQHYAHLAAVATAAAAAAAVSVSAASASSTPASSTRTRRSATKPTVSTAQSTSTQPQPVAVPKPIRRRTNDPNTPRAEWTWERDQILFDILASVESAKTPIEVGSWSAKHWDLVAQSLSERGIPGNGQQRYAVLRREWRTLCELLKKPGFTWDEAEGKVSASEEVWEAHMNSLTVPFHKVAAARLRDKPYPHYQRAKALWGLALKDGPPAITSTVHPSAALAASRDAFAIKSGRPHTPESPPTTLAYKEGSLPPGAAATAASAAGGDSSLSSSHHHHLLQHHTPAPSAAANGLQQHHQHQLQHHSDLDFLRSPSRDRDDAIFSAQELSDLIGSVPNSTAKSGSMMPSPSLHFDPTAPPPPPPPTSHASFIPPPLIPYPLGSPMLSTNPRKRRAPLLPSSSSHPHFTDLPPPTAKRHKPVTLPQAYPPPPFAYQPSMSPVHPHALYGQTSLAPPPPPLHTSDPLYSAVSAAAALAGTSVPGSPLDPDMDHADTAHGRSSPPAPPVPPPSLADAMALAMAWLAGQRAAAGGVDAALMLSAAHVFMQDERVLYMFLALPEDLRVLFLRQRVEANGEAEARGGEVAGGAGQGVDGDV